MVDSKIIKYIKDTFSAGYDESQVREALAKQGWYKEEIDEAMAIAGTPETVPKPETETPAPTVRAAPLGGKITGGLMLAVAGGALIILNSLLVYVEVGDMLGLFLQGFSISFLNMFDVALSSFDALVINVIIGGFLMGTSYILYSMPDKAKITGMFMVALSLITILVGNGFLIGGIIAMVGGLFAILGR